MIKKEVHRLEELIRTATNNILTPEERISYLLSPDLKNRLNGKFPECFISLKRMGQDTSEYLLPLCNRAGIIDPLAINISYRIVGKLLSDSTGLFDVNNLQSIFDKLTRLKDRYEKEVPKPAQAAARKALVTRLFNNIKGHLAVISPKD